MFRELDIYSDFVTNSHGEYWDSVCEKLWVPVQNHSGTVFKNVSPRRKMLGPLCNQTVNPLSPISAQDQFSPNDIHRLSWTKSMRINKMITERKNIWSFTKFSQIILQGNVRRPVWRICMWILGLKGLSWRQTPQLCIKVYWNKSILIPL